jgi:hypothetical protein
MTDGRHESQNNEKNRNNSTNFSEHSIRGILATGNSFGIYNKLKIVERISLLVVASAIANYQNNHQVMIAEYIFPIGL